MIIPDSIQEFLNNRHKGIISPCESCNSNCCVAPGFAIFENVIEIYEIYKSEKLKRIDYTFESNLTLSQFVLNYFDRVLMANKLLIFFPKMLNKDKKLISVPPSIPQWNYWDNRNNIRKIDKSYGCIFLERLRMENDSKNIKCILHSDKQNEINQKPVDCLFLYCRIPQNIEKPAKIESINWFSLLDSNFPKSNERFKALCPDIKDF